MKYVKGMHYFEVASVYVHVSISKLLVGLQLNCGPESALKVGWILFWVVLVRRKTCFSGTANLTSSKCLII
jgi:hypothetical protein